MPVKKFKDPLLGAQNSSTGSLKKSIQTTILKAPKSEVASESEPPYTLRNPLQKVPPSYTSLAEGAKKYQQDVKEHIKGNWNRISRQVTDYLLEDNPKLGKNNLRLLLEETKLKDIGVFAGISTEKTLLMEGAPTAIIGHAEQKKLDELLPALLQEVKRRGASIELTERKAQVKLDKK